MCAFCSGKTTVSRLLQRRIAGSYRIDFERIGYVLRRPLPVRRRARRLGVGRARIEPYRHRDIVWRKYPDVGIGPAVLLMHQAINFGQL